MSLRKLDVAALLLLILACLEGRALLWAQTPTGSVFRVNSVTATSQDHPRVSMDRAGRAVVQWLDSNMEPSRLVHPRVAVQRFNPQGGRINSEFEANNPPFSAYGASGVFALGGGEFLILWSEVQGLRHFARHYRATGEASAPPIVIDDSGSQLGYFDALLGYGAREQGELVGVWSRISLGENPQDLGTFARWFDRNAAPLTPETFLPDAFSNNGRPWVDVVAGPDRSVFVGWNVSADPDELYWDLHLQAYSATGEKLGPKFQVLRNFGDPEAGMAWNPLTRQVVIAWRSAVSHGTGFTEQILLQRLAPDGQPVTPQPTVVSETGGIPAAVACNVRGYCAVTWFRERVGIVVRIVRPDGRVLPKEVVVAAVPAYPNWIAYGGNGALMVVWTDDYSSTTDPADIAARRLIASPGDEVCQRLGNEVHCDAGRTGSLPELRLAPFDLSRKEVLLFGDADGDGRADPCRARNGTWRCDTDHEGESTETTLGFAGSGAGTPLLGDLDGDGKSDACTWAGGLLRCDTGHDGGSPELTLTYGGRKEIPHLADLDGDGRDDLCLGSRGSLRCDVGHNGGRTEIRLSFGQAGDQLVFGDFDGDGTDDPCVARAGKLLCDTAHDGGAWEAEILLGTPGAPVLLGNLDGV